MLKAGGTGNKAGELNHHNWIFLDEQGGRHKVGIYHGPGTGNLMIYCNAKIVLIDFLVKKPKTYSFFINEEFCEIVLHEEEDKRFTYEFKINKKVDTPLNKMRHARELKYMTYTIILLALFLLFLGIIVFLVF